ncbi:monofunctional C1-tetrahydrofolate synthase, mitochondrial isoform X7 [Chrysemys picta bellii]|uniref:monofunctional C1-tetrahydrofolate synthase, mitochondrial isoform X7 n=1 Tax=Chrysemys picta bellii TaxID=8478 RepID=UPI0032B174D2
MRFSALWRLSRGAAAPLAGRKGTAPRRGTASTWGRWEKQQAGGARGSAAGEIIQSSKKVLASLQKGHPTFKPTLAIVQVSDEDLVQDVNQNFGKEIGLHVIHICLPQGSSEDEIVGEILRLNEDPTVHGVALHLSENAYSSKILNAIKPEKDVDGVSDVNLGRLVRGDTYNCSVSPTASAVMELLEKLAVKTVDGKKVLLVETCGPLEASLQCLLQRKGAMTMSCQWKTQQLQSKRQMLRNRARRLRQRSEDMKSESGTDLSQSTGPRAVNIMVAMGHVDAVERRFWARETSTDWWDRIVLQV